VIVELLSSTTLNLYTTGLSQYIYKLTDPATQLFLSPRRSMSHYLPRLFKACSKSSLNLLLRLWRWITILLSRRGKLNQVSDSSSVSTDQCHTQDGALEWRVAVSKDHTHPSVSSGGSVTVSTGPTYTLPSSIPSVSGAVAKNTVSDGATPSCDTIPKNENNLPNTSEFQLSHLRGVPADIVPGDQISLKSTRKWKPCTPDHSPRFKQQEW